MIHLPADQKGPRALCFSRSDELARRESPRRDQSGGEKICFQQVEHSGVRFIFFLAPPWDVNANRIPRVKRC